MEQSCSRLAAATRIAALSALLSALLFGGTVAAVAAPPANDAVTDAIAIGGLPFTTTTDTSEATIGAEDSGCGVATAWYTFTPPTDGTYLLTTLGSDFDTTLAALEGQPGNLSLIACSDDALGGFQSALRLELSGGTTYFIEAGTCCGGGEVGQIGPGGTLVLNVEETTPALQISSFTVDRVTRGAAPQIVVVSGRVTCTSAGEVSVSGTLRQRQGLNIAIADFFSEPLPCSTTPTTWTATADAVTRVWLNKRATVTASAFACDQFACDEAQVNRSIKVNRR